METNTILQQINDEQMEVQQLMLPLSEEEINIVPFKDSWTAAQLAAHVIKSNNAIAQALEMNGHSPKRDPAEKVKELRDTFLNFEIKMKSPSFIVPEDHYYKKKAVTDALKKSAELLLRNAGDANLEEMIDLPAAFGEITKLELIHFVLYHTKRHHHQLKNILQQLTSEQNAAKK